MGYACVEVFVGGKLLRVASQQLPGDAYIKKQRSMKKIIYFSALMMKGGPTLTALFGRQESIHSIVSLHPCCKRNSNPINK